MKKFLLFFLVFLLLLGTGSLAFGFWNGKDVRKWAISADEIRVRHNIAGKEKNLEERFGSNWSSAENLKSNSQEFAAELEKTKNDIDVATKEIENLSGPWSVQDAKKDILDHYAQSKKQIDDLSNVVAFMNQLFEAAVIFDRMKEDATLEDIQAMIKDAKEKSAVISVDILPSSLGASGSGLKSATDNFFETMEQTVSGKIDTSDQLNASYADFSREENQFFVEAKKYIDSFPDLSPLAKKIDAELSILGKVKFSLR
jgi:hypothetical protein